jgi:dihydrofolate synthase/folylpolyglutamate synthase
VNYAEAIAWLLSFADFETGGRFQERPDVAPMHTLLHRLGDPHVGRRTVHVAGSKGKGSVCAVVESILRAAGISTGLFTSPHLHDYTERIRTDGAPISRDDFAPLADEVREAVEDTAPALTGRRFVTFDLLAAMCFLAFREARVEVQIIEVGLGGRVDSTNVFETKDVAVITPLSYEHTAILGDRIEQIAAEKAAIITPGCTAVVALQAYQDAASVVREFAQDAGADLVDVASEYRWSVTSRNLRGQTIRIERSKGVVEAQIPLLGDFQADNAAAAAAAVDALGPGLESLGYVVGDDAIVRGLESVSWPGRIEVLSEQPLVVADGAHNSDSARRLRETLVEHFAAKEVTFIIGSGADKDIGGLARELAPLAAQVIATKSQHPRAMEPRLVCQAFSRENVPCEDVDSVSEAIGMALDGTAKRGVICLAGSLFVAAEAREYFQEQTIEPVGGAHGG